MVKHYLSLIKFNHTVFALPFAVVGFALAVSVTEASFEWLTLGKVVLCMVFARSAAMAFNRYADRGIDARNPRTAGREIPAGVIRPWSALAFAAISGVLFMVTAWFINTVCFLLSPVALAVILGYSYTKRFTPMSHFVLGLGLSLAPIGAWLAVAGAFDLLPLLYSAAVLFWVGGFDIIYALQDEDFDRSHRLRSLPVLLGRETALRLSSVLHVLTAAALVCAGFRGDMGTWYWAGAASFITLLARQHTLVRPDDLRRINLAFFTTNGLASVLFAFFVILDLCLAPW